MDLGGKIVNQDPSSKIERNIEVDNQAGASIQDLQSSVALRMPDILHPRHIVRHTL